MNHIDRLLLQAKRARGGMAKHILGFVDYDFGREKFTASGTIWDGVEGSGGELFYSEHDTKEQALAACAAVAALYPSCENINFLLEYGMED